MIRDTAMTQSENANLTRGSGFNEKKFISDLYACETIKKVLTDRIKKLKSDLDWLGSDKKDLRIPSFDQSKFRQEYNREKQLQKYPQKPKEPYVIKLRHEIEFADSAYCFGLVFGISIVTFLVLALPLAWIMDNFSKTAENIVFTIFVGSLILVPFILTYIVFFQEPLHKYFNGKKALKKYKSDMQQYKNTCDALEKNSTVIEANNSKLWQLKQSAYNEWVANEKAKYRTYSEEYEREREIKEYLLQQELNAAQHKLSIVNKTLISLYALQINGVFCIHPTYQGLIPVSVIYGYFDTGRCSSLRGHEGAYNLYEDERIKGIIINQLGDIARSLKQLNASMCYVGYLLDNCERQLKILNKNMETLLDETSRMNANINESFFEMNNNISRNHQGIADRVGQIEANTANSAYYAEIGAKMSTMHTFYSICKDL